MKNLIALICVAALITVITGCSESIYSEQNGGNSQSPESAKMPGIEADLNPEQPKETLQPLESAETPKIEQEARINTELLS
ncbi:MAG: hypothetical protein LBC82_04755, partial [Oscillospiraceae bacterium]|nr:hypothetical protein [Oscillospiraceae bacterium]